MKINKDFFFGTASSGPQSEGAFNKVNESIFDYWHREDSSAFFNHVGPDKQNEVYHRYLEDVMIMKELGLENFRTSIQWSRLIKDFYTLEVDEDAVRFYDDYFNALIEAGIEPYVNLYHFDMPKSLQDIGGLASKEVIKLYVRYAEKCFDLWGDKIKTWFTFNEPIVPIEAQYLYKFHYPLSVDSKLAVQAAYNTALANAMVVSEYKKRNLGGRIGIILNLTPSYPASQSEEDLSAANYADLFFNRSFLDPAVKGEFPKELVDVLKEYDYLPEYTLEELEIIKENKIDYLGVNYYQPRRVKKSDVVYQPGEMLMPEHFAASYEMPNRRMNPYRGWEIYPEGLYDISKNIMENYGNIDWFVSENGMGVEGEERFLDESGVINDDYRIEFIKEHLANLFKGINEGSNCKGYHLWTFVDNWSWTNAYKNRYGYVSLDLETKERTIKKSGYFIKEVILQKNKEGEINL